MRRRMVPHRPSSTFIRTRTAHKRNSKKYHSIPLTHNSSQPKNPTHPLYRFKFRGNDAFFLLILIVILILSLNLLYYRFSFFFSFVCFKPYKTVRLAKPFHCPICNLGFEFDGKRQFRVIFA